MVSEHNVTLIERFYDMYNGNNGIYFIDKADDNRFIQNQCIFTDWYAEHDRKAPAT